MNFEEKLKHTVMACLLAAGGAQTALAADAPLAVVNGTAIAASALDRAMEPYATQGQKDSPQLRAALAEELIARELMVQEAQKRGLDKLPTTQEALQMLHQNLLIDLLLNDEFSKRPVTPDDLKAEYERQVKLLKANDLQQHQLAVIVLESEADARTALAELKSGKAFDVVAKARSVDASKDKGGDLGWLLPEQITPAISNVVVNLSTGSVTVAPIQVGRFWHVVKLMGRRSYEIPSFQDSQQQLQAAVRQQRRAAMLQKLQETAKIKR